MDFCDRGPLPSLEGLQKGRNRVSWPTQYSTYPIGSNTGTEDSPPFLCFLDADKEGLRPILIELDERHKYLVDKIRDVHRAACQSAGDRYTCLIQVKESYCGLRKGASSSLPRNRPTPEIRKGNKFGRGDRTQSEFYLKSKLNFPKSQKCVFHVTKTVSAALYIEKEMVEQLHGSFRAQPGTRL